MLLYRSAAKLQALPPWRSPFASRGPTWQPGALARDTVAVYNLVRLRTLRARHEEAWKTAAAVGGTPPTKGPSHTPGLI